MNKPTEVATVKIRATPSAVSRDAAEVAEIIREIIYSGTNEDIKALSKGLKKGDLYLNVHTLNDGFVEVDDWINERF